MKTIINKESKDHHVQNYKFKVLSMFDKEDNHEEDLKEDIESHIEETNEVEENINTEEVVKNEPLIQTNTINEELLSKIDELSSNVVKLQMKLERQEEEFNNRLNSELEVAKKNAYEEGLNAAKEQNEATLNELSIKVANSVKKLESKCDELSAFCEKSKKDLNEAACFIAKEVVNKELSEHSSKIALSYANTIMQDIDKSIKIRLSVNPKDFDYINSELSSNRVEVLADEAINIGCLVINSDALNTQISIKERLNQARSMVLDEE